MASRLHGLGLGCILVPGREDADLECAKQLFAHAQESVEDRCKRCFVLCRFTCDKSYPIVVKYTTKGDNGYREQDAFDESVENLRGALRNKRGKSVLRDTKNKLKHVFQGRKCGG